MTGSATPLIHVDSPHLEHSFFTCSVSFSFPQLRQNSSSVSSNSPTKSRSQSGRMHSPGLGFVFLIKLKEPFASKYNLLTAPKLVIPSERSCAKSLSLVIRVFFIKGIFKTESSTRTSKSSWLNFSNFWFLDE